MSLSARLIKSVAASVGVRVSRTAHAGRFTALDVCLSRMKDRGFAPRVIIDGGANTGQFYRLALSIFPDAHYHLIEPQPACRDVLIDFVESRPRTTELHRVAVTRPGASTLRMAGSGTTGAYVTKRGEPYEIESPATTLDALFDSRLAEEDRCLLKLDLESHELSALSGASSLLDRVEAILLEVSFYDIENWGRPVFRDVMSFMSRSSFELYDIASLASRPRDERLRLGDVVFLRRGTPLLEDRTWV